MAIQPGADVFAGADLTLEHIHHHSTADQAIEKVVHKAAAQRFRGKAESNIAGVRLVRFAAIRIGLTRMGLCYDR